MPKIAFKMHLNPGMADEYRRRHSPIWPELEALLRGVGVSDYSIHLDPETDILFAVMWLADGHGMDDLPSHPVMRQWWDYMADIMLVKDGNEPMATQLLPMFHMV